ncbi:hypothetical protein M2324_001650 [Rhodovulum sulfidophilum]|uniref:hypothetical protein n=1 Tax=Rhodovulum sulfidophilum TaxID=35806 RepID=UPI0005A98582|nr:hypothetical protein [Rhodovulum sulfidophilum]ANB32744.1 hypothetical protein A6W98_00820 [Rhodovulum sulfidophilum DSM 1374]ANB36593.1 hypothetical protein A6024_00805 [Rhodovulum sulfidophilum]MBL3565425.1 hypothetical protein [Rhodovulum sulfidophilum]MCE8438346.1 hypothetical protein [Rhodovulum sulfidophilum]MCE8470844.1 hypothetical protein [Rhodovulum sulfidophilum]
MEQLIAEIEAYAAAWSKSPQKVLRDAIGASWGQWEAWKSGQASPTMRVADKLRDHMRTNPAPAIPEDAARC